MSRLSGSAPGTCFGSPASHGPRPFLQRPPSGATAILRQVCPVFLMPADCVIDRANRVFTARWPRIGRSGRRIVGRQASDTGTTGQIAALTGLRGIGPNDATLLVNEAVHRDFDNRQQQGGPAACPSGPEGLVLDPLPTGQHPDPRVRGLEPGLKLVGWSRRRGIITIVRKLLIAFPDYPRI